MYGTLAGRELGKCRQSGTGDFVLEAAKFRKPRFLSSLPGGVVGVDGRLFRADAFANHSEKFVNVR